VVMNVKQLICELEKIDNKYLEIESCVEQESMLTHSYKTYEVIEVRREKRKVLLINREFDYG